MANATAARLNYLSDAAHLLALSSPSTAAFLQSRIDGLAAGETAFDAAPDPRAATGADYQDATLPLPKTRHLDICTSCGSLLSTQSLHFEIVNDRRLKGSGTGSELSTKRLYAECRKCSAKTFQDLIKPEKAKKQKRQPKAGTTEATTTMRLEHSAVPKTEEAMATKTANASSRKRAKGRKSNSLSAMLAKSKQDTASSSQGFGLDLMDLMKST
jgi:hypothetical protein